MAKNDNDQKRYAKILRDIIAGKGLSKTDQSFFIDYSSTMDDTSFQRIQESELKDYSQQDIENAIGNGYSKAVQSSPEYRDKLIDFAEKTERSKVAGAVRNGLNIALATADIAASAKQIKAGEKAAGASRRPGRPAPLQADPLLAQAIEEARAGTFDTARRLAPAQQALLDTYLSDLNVARTASTGQAGTYGALGQAAVNRRRRGAIELAPIADDIRAREQSRLDNLIGAKLNENQAIQQSRAQFYPTELEQYRAEQMAAGNLGATGRSNMRQSLVNLGQNIPDIAAQLATKRRFDRLRMSDGMYGTGGIAQQADNIANQRANGTFNYNAAPDFLSPEIAEAYGISPRRIY